MFPIPPRRIIPSLGIPSAPREALPQPELQFVSHIGPMLAAAFGPDKAGKGSAFVTTAAGSLEQFSYPGFRPQATYRLDQPAYRAVLDGRRGLLWVAASAPDALRVSRHGDRPAGRGDLHLYDVRSLSGTPRPDTTLHPRRVLPLNGNVTELLAAPDQSRLFYLAQTDRGVHIGRIDADKEKLDAELSLPRETHALCLTADGKTLYAAGAGVVSAIDTATLRVRRRLDVEGDIWSVTADNAGHVYLGRQGQWTDVTLLDLSGTTPSPQHWSASLHGRVYMKLAADQNRLYASSSSVISNLIEALLVPGQDRLPPPHQIGVTRSPSAGIPLSRDRRFVGGEFFLSPDGQFLVSCWGHVFQLASGAMHVRNGHPPSVPPLISRLRGGGPPG
jgi:hypothetical protein